MRWDQDVCDDGSEEDADGLRGQSSMKGQTHLEGTKSSEEEAPILSIVSAESKVHFWLANLWEELESDSTVDLGRSAEATEIRGSYGYVSPIKLSIHRRFETVFAYPTPNPLLRCQL